MTLRRKTLLIVAFSLLGVMAGGYFVASTLMMKDFESLEKENVILDVNRFKAALKTLILTYEAKARDWAFWDDTYQFVQDQNDAYRQANLTNASTENLGVNYLLYINTEGKVVFEKNIDLNTGQDIPIPDRLSENFLEFFPAESIPELKDCAQGLLSVEGKSMIVAACPILPSGMDEPARGVLVLGKYFSIEEKEKLARDMRLDISVVNYDDEHMPNDFKEALENLLRRGGIFIRAIDENTNAGYTMVSDMRGNPVLLFRLKALRQIYGRGKASVRFLLYATIAAGLIFSTVFLGILNSLIVKRVFSLSQEVSSIASSANMGSRISVRGNDELASLGYNINHMLSKLETAQKQVFISEEQFRGIFNSSKDAIAYLDLQEHIIDLNPSFSLLFGYQRKEAVGHLTLNDLIVEEERDFQKIKLEHIIQTDRSVEYEILCLRQDKTRVPVMISLFVVQGIDGKGKGLAFIAKDITERKAAEQKMRESAEIKIQFASMVSHELRTPLSVIKESIEIVYDGAAGPVNAEQKSFMQIAKDSIGRLTRLINSVLDFQKLEAGGMIFDFKPQNLNSILQSVAQGFSLVAAKNGLHLKCELAPALPDLLLDRDKIIQVLTNYLNNAFKFTEKGCVCVKSEAGDNWVKVSVIDEGPGIAKQDIFKLFQSFSQIGDQGKKGGTGLGLAISKKIIEFHNGKVGLETELGKGSNFYFILPIMERRSPKA